MKSRCFNKESPSYKNYGGRGIGVCARWMNFDNFAADMVVRPRPDYKLDRINNDGNYEPSNCRWVSPKESANNRRPQAGLIDAGTRFGRWTVVTQIKIEGINGRCYECICDCGKTYIVHGNSLREGRSRGCKPCLLIRMHLQYVAPFLESVLCECCLSKVNDLKQFKG